MNIYKRLLYLFQIFNLFINISAYIKLFNTENTLATQSYDCIYYTNITARNNETTPYCVRTAEMTLLNRSFTSNSCKHSSKEWSFRNLKEMNVSQDDVLTWNSSIEMADRYAAYLVTGDEQFADDKICNCSSNTFGKFCEYKFITNHTFEQAIQYQFYLKMKYRNGSQLWGNITCYKTLNNCNYGLRCLTWHNICDGKQQCMDGIDEDHCEELEMNECEEDEYRCGDGSCISEYYWLDGQYDCSDKSDEQLLVKHFLSQSLCPLASSQFICDETKAYGHNYFACGDGSFTDDHLSSKYSCYNYRNYMFFCEFPLRNNAQENLALWTLENGHCVDKGVMQKKLTEMDESEMCIFYLKCKLMFTGTIIGCDDVIRLFYSFCQNKKIIYPSGPIFKPYIQTLYLPSQLDQNLYPNYILLNGSIRCIGYHASFTSNVTLLRWITVQGLYPIDGLYCRYSEKRNASGPQIDKNCWNYTKQSFLCNKTLQCISKHRVRNNINDCRNGEDESDSQKCYMKNKHLFHCLRRSFFLCLFAIEIGDMVPFCDNANDEYIPELKWNLADRKCTTPDSVECNFIKTYIRSASLLSTNEIHLFREYCDTVWHLPRGVDESLCHQWKCPKDQYQCLSGHCISVNYVLRSIYAEWYCPDASDNIRLLKIAQLSEHNNKLISHSRLLQQKTDLIKNSRNNIRAPFTRYCDGSTEYGCILANVNDSLDFIINRPCINLTQIGDGIIDCYGGLDERNLLGCGNNGSQQRGYDFYCSNQECIPYHRHCIDRCSNKADNLLCDQFSILFWDSSCDRPSREDLCTYVMQEPCDLFQTSKYYCDGTRRGDVASSTPYRSEGWTKRPALIDLPEYPVWKDIVIYHYVQSLERQPLDDYSNISHEQKNDGQEGWICGRGVAIKRNQINEVQCFCPPSLYGKYCQYFSDRITLITSLNNIPSELLERESNTIKIVALLLFNDITIDHFVFHLPVVFSKDLNKKFRFNLIYQRPKLLSNSYELRFQAYYLKLADSSITFLGIWKYAIRLPFLPSYRFAQILRFEKEMTLITAEHICRKANPCLHNSTCYSIMNKINDTSAYYCHCNNHTFGKHCEYLFQTIMSPVCAKNALSYPLTSIQSICLCPIHSYGPTCHLNYTCVNKNPCGDQRGKCYINPDNIIHDYICICDKKFFGNHCELHSSMIQINFTNFSFVQIPTNFILATIIQLCNLDSQTLDLNVLQKRVYQGLPPSITQIYHNDYYLPIIGIMKFYHKYDLSNDYVANLKQSDYFILYITSNNISQMNFTLEINMTNFCPYTPTIFYNNISNASYLSQFLISNTTDLHNGSILIFKYHLLCDAPYFLFCFHDNNYFCICDIYNHTECFRYDSRLDECNGQCRANGQCIRGDLNDRRSFVCLCPKCYHGSICQHTTELFSFTLETLLTYDLDSTSLVVQRLFFILLIITPASLFLIGLMSNVCCYVTFNRPKPLLVGIGQYLRTASIINQLTLLMLLFKLLHLVLSIKGHIVQQLLNTIFCKVLSYLLVCSSRMSYWLMSMVAIERVYITWSIQGTWLKSPLTAKYIIATIIIGIVACDVHELIYYQSIEDPKSLSIINSTWCVTSYPSAVTIYNQVNIILNYALPFLINLLSTITLIILITQKRMAAFKPKNNRSTSKSKNSMTLRAYINLLITNRELILAPSVTMLPQLFALPQFILSFSLACQEFKVNWQRYLLTISYFITYLPQVISYKLYVSPSSFYTDEFHATKLYQKISKWRDFIRRR